MTGLRFVPVGTGDELAQPLLAELAIEYATRYEAPEAAVATWLRNHPAGTFSPPDGGMLIGVIGDRPVTGGAFCRFDDDTAELKRIWTDSGSRRRGYATKLLAALEAEIAERGYRRVYLTTGNRQPEAEALYDSTGYTRLDEPLPSHGDVFPVAFIKALSTA
ncbi:acetyltransferase (GNAT) family protein [Mycobacterium sp. BK086]|uniref:GNAT family N-acetyltransferase n=1 Tax=Mycobacterium sp. BK086 TaxID=2512165 RepID=UPI00105D549D|nr:GNAT family N-acetyltransferase [Mycobacterium sp. BK086]TDO07875.1 acetyltransferase (GNAT) family protein [Mycobacterium sp. BK086]